MIRDYLEINQQMDHFHFEYCPKCGQHHPMLVKAGKTKLVNRCWNVIPVKNALYVIMVSWLTILINRSQNGTIWSSKRRMEIRCFIQLLKSMYMNPLLFVCVTNIFISLKIWSVPYVLHHEIEMDETYVTHCRKGRLSKIIPARSGGPVLPGPVCPMRKCA